MIKLLVIFILGILEVITIGKLHETLGTKNLVILYVITTLFGAIVAWTVYSNYKRHKDRVSLGNKFTKRAKKGEFIEKDVKSMVSLLYCMTYIFGCILIAIPGILSDLLGILLVLPPVGNVISKTYGETLLDHYPEDDETV